MSNGHCTFVVARIFHVTYLYFFVKLLVWKREEIFCLSSSASFLVLSFLCHWTGGTKGLWGIFSFIRNVSHVFDCSFIHSFRLFIRLFVCSFIHWFIGSFVGLIIVSFVRSFVHLFVCLFICLSVRPSACPCVCSFSVRSLARSYARMHARTLARTHWLT